MSEKDVVTGIIINPTQPSSSTTIIFSKQVNLGQFGNVAQSITTAEQKKGIRIPMDVMTNATYTTGDIAVKMDRPLQLPPTLAGQETGVFTNERGTVTWQGNRGWIITNIEFPVNPLTREPLPAPTQTSVLGNSAKENLAPQITSGNTTFSSSYVGPMTNEQLVESKKAP